MKRRERLDLMLYKLQHGGAITATGCAAEFSISQRQAWRDILALQNEGHPIYNNEQKPGEYLMLDSLKSKACLTGRESLALLMCVQAFESAYSPFYGALQLGRQKLLDALPENVKTAVLETLAVTDVETLERYRVKDELFEKLLTAACDRKQIRMSYRSNSSSSELTQRLIDPYGLVFKMQAWYLVAFCHLRNEVRVFRPDRIERYNVLPEPEEPVVWPEGFSLQKFFDNSWGIGRGAEQQVRMRFLPEVAKQVKRSAYHPTQKFVDLQDGSVEMHVMVNGLWEITRWILSFGSVVEVLEPEALRKDVIDMINKTKSLYEDKQ